MNLTLFLATQCNNEIGIKALENQRLLSSNMNCIYMLQMGRKSNVISYYFNWFTDALTSAQQLVTGIIQLTATSSPCCQLPSKMTVWGLYYV